MRRDEREHMEANATDRYLDDVLEKRTGVEDEALSLLRTLPTLPRRLVEFEATRGQTSRLRALGFVGLVAAVATLLIGAAAAGAVTLLLRNDDEVGAGMPVFAISLDGRSEPQLLARNLGLDAVGRPGQVIAVNAKSDAPSEWDLVLLRDQTARTLIEGVGNDFSISKDASRIAYRQGSHLTFASLPDGASIRQIDLQTDSTQLFSLSPNLEMVAFASTRPDGAKELAYATIQGDIVEISALPKWVGEVGSASWLTNDALLVLPFPPSQPLVVRLDGTVNVFGSSQQEVWRAAPSPDGKLVALQGQPMDGNTPWQIVDDEGLPQYALPLGMTFLDWSPDGTRFVAEGRDGSLHVFFRNGVESAVLPGFAVRDPESDSPQAPAVEPIGTFHWSTDDTVLLGSSGFP